MVAPTRASRMLPTVRTLPVDAYRDDFVANVRCSDVVVALAETGSGKTTRLPQFILDDSLARGDPCRIAVTQPRRIAAVSAANQVASERGERLHSTSGCASVGFAIRGESKLPTSANSILYLTEGLLVARFHYSDYTHIILDEVHERSINTDTLLCLCKLARRSRQSCPKLVLMSATVDPSFFRQFFADLPADCVAATPMSRSDGSALHGPLSVTACPMSRSDGGTGALPPLRWSETRIDGRLFPVQRLFLDDAPIQPCRGNRPETAVSSAVSFLFARYGVGNVLIFVASVREVEACSAALAHFDTCSICPLHAKVSAPDRARALASDARSSKIVVATNVAEASVTIPDIRFVIDFMRERLPPQLNSSFISKASHLQREGRTGRCCSGICLLMCTKSVYDDLSDFRRPEVGRGEMLSCFVSVSYMRPMSSSDGYRLECLTARS